MKADRFIVLEIDEETIRLGMFSRSSSGKLELLDQGVALLDSDSTVPMAPEARVATALKKLLDEKKPSARRVILTIGGKSVFSRVIKLPPVAADRVAATIGHEAVQNIPFPIDEVVWDSYIEDPAAAEPNVLLVAVKADLIEGLIHAVSANGLSVTRVDVVPVALANVVRHIYSDAVEPRLVVNAGADSCDVIFIDGLRTYFRALSVKATDQGGLIQEIGRSITFYRSLPDGNAPTQILLTGNVESAGEMEKSLGVPVAMPDFGSVLLEANENVEGLAVLVGSAMSSFSQPALSIDLMPASILAARKQHRYLPWWYACSAVIMLILGVWISGLSQMSALAGQEIKAVSAEVHRLEKIEAKMEPLEAEIRKLELRDADYQRIDEQRSFWIGILRELEQRLPDGMFILSGEPLHEPEMPQGIRIELVSFLDKEPAGQDVVKVLRDSLRESDKFNAETRIHSRPSKGKFLRQFVLDLYFEEEPVK